MEIAKSYVRDETEALDDLEAYLQGHVFHVTRLAYLPSIIQCGEVRPNRSGTYPTTFGFSTNAFFRNRNCVSLFDYRPVLTEGIREFRRRCDPFRPARPPNGSIAILVLDRAAYDTLVPWTKWKEENEPGEMIVPYVEAGYPGPLPLSSVAEIMSLEIIEEPDSFPARLRRAHEAACIARERK